VLFEEIVTRGYSGKKTIFKDDVKPFRRAPQKQAQVGLNGLRCSAKMLLFMVRKEMNNSRYLQTDGWYVLIPLSQKLQNFYKRSVDLSKHWILIGQQHGVIQQSVDPDKTSEMFVLLSFGLRIRSSVQTNPAFFTAQDLSSFMARTLKS